jgi:AcrR family transcriptional regulator
MATAGVSDGRRMRAERSREAIVGAVLDLLREGVEQPSADAVAARAGISPRSVFRHFDDLEALYAMAAARQGDVLLHLLRDAPREGSLDERLGHLVQRRAELFEEILHTRRAAERLRFASDAIAEGLAMSRRALRRQLLETLGADAPPKRQAVVLDALEAVTGFGMWHQLRVDQRLTVSAATRAMTVAARAVAAATS